MANTGVKGRIVFAESGVGIRNLKVCAFDIDPVTEDDLLGIVEETADDGSFSITYTPDKYRLWIFDRNPDIEVRIYGPGHRLLWETTKRDDVQVGTLDLGDIAIHENNFPVGSKYFPQGSAPTAEQIKDDKSWLVTHTSLDPARGVAKRLTTGNKVEWLIDGAIMFPAITEAIEDANTSIRFMNLAFYIEELYSKLEFPTGKNHKNVLPSDQVIVSRVERILKRKVRDDGVAVHLLVWELENFKDLLIKLFDKADTADEVRDYFEGTGVHASSLETSQLLHIKLLVVDGETAFIIGSTMSPAYFSDHEHLIRDARHRGRSLMHDVSLRLKGPAVHDVDETFTTIWNVGPTVSPITPSPATTTTPGDMGVQVLRTLPGEMFVKDPPNVNDPAHIPYGETGILESYQRAIMLAEEYIYIEDQYFVSDEIAKAILLRMKERPNLEVILVLNVKPDIGGYERKQAALIKEMRASLGTQQNRLGVFTIWSTDSSSAPMQISHIYMHSKLAIIDDKWATVGTANVDGASLNQRQWGLILKGEARAKVEKILEQISGLSLKKKIAAALLGPLLTALVLMAFGPLLLLFTRVGLHFSLPSLIGFVFKSLIKEIARTTQHANPGRKRQPPRHPELNLTVYNDIAGQTPTDKVLELRLALWSEHLGKQAPADKPASGWLDSVWNPVAEIDLKQIKNAATPPIVPLNLPSRKLLKWVPEFKPKNYLKALGVQVSNIKIRSGGEELKFRNVEKDLN